MAIGVLVDTDLRFLRVALELQSAGLGGEVAEIIELVAQLGNIASTSALCRAMSNPEVAGLVASINRRSEVASARR